MSHKKKKHQKELTKKKLPKISASKRRKFDDPDPNIVIAVLSLPREMKNAKGVIVTLPSGQKRYDTASHIAARKHYFHVVDIEEFPKIIANKRAVSIDRYDKDSRNYIGKRPGDNTASKSEIKIVTRSKSGYEVIVTAYPVKKSR